MKIQELLEAATRDKTRKDHNGNFLGFDPERKVWVVIPRYDGIGMIRKGELKNGVLDMKTSYPEFNPSAAPKPDSDTSSKYKDPNTVGAFGHAVDKAKDALNVNARVKKAGRDAVDTIAAFPKAVGSWMDKERDANRSRGPGTN